MLLCMHHDVRWDPQQSAHMHAGYIVAFDCGGPKQPKKISSLVYVRKFVFL